MDLSEAAVSAMLYSVSMMCGTLLCVLFLIPCCGNFRTSFVFVHEVVREVTSRMCQLTPPSGGCVVLFLHRHADC